MIDELVSDDEEDEVHPPAENPPAANINLQLRREREINSPWIFPSFSQISVKFVRIYFERVFQVKFNQI